MVEGTAHNKSSNKRRDITRLILSVVILVLCNVVGSFVFHRFDLTSEKRYTLSPQSKKIAENLKDVAFFKVYLEGKDLPAGFVRLRDETKEMLDEFKAFSNNKVEYEFINPSADPSNKEALFRQLNEQGLQPLDLHVKQNGANMESIIWPGALLSYKGRQMPINLLQQKMDVGAQTQLNNSIEELEYNIDNAIHKIDLDTKPVIAFIQGHGELDSLHLAGAIDALSEYYDVRLLHINHQLNGLQMCKAIIIAKPTQPINDKDAYIIDQFLMKGGKILWCIDPLYTPMDSLVRNGMTMAFPNNLNLTDQLFRYGVRINNNVILDAQSAAIPMNTAFKGQEPKWELEPWLFEPLLSSNSDNPIVKNLNFIELNIAATIDTIGQPGIKKTILLRTSKFTKLLNAPVRIALAMALDRLDQRAFTQPFQPAAVLLEGKFTSAYKGRIAMPDDSIKKLGTKFESPQTAMIVVGDGDVIANAAREDQHYAYPLGYDIYTKQQYGNKDFIVNAMNYLVGDSALLTIRTKQLKLRLLDGIKAEKYRTQWQVINMAIPVALIILLGLIWAWVRKEKYAK